MNLSTYIPCRLVLLFVMALPWAFAQGQANGICQPPIAPAAQWTVSDTAQTFTFENISLEKNAAEIEWSINADFSNSKINPSAAPFKIKVNPGSAVVIWLRSRDNGAGCVSEPVTTVARVERIPNFTLSIPDSGEAYPCGDDIFKAVIYQYNRADYDRMIEEDNRVIQAAAYKVAQRQGQIPLPQNSPAAGPRSNTYVIPVVVHVIHPLGEAYGAGSNISYAQVQSAINQMNAAFAANYPGYNGQTNAAPAINTGVRFCLANNTYPSSVQWTDPNEPGVMRYPTNDQAAMSPAFNNRASYSAPTNLTGYPTNFPPDKYFNFWVVPTIQSGNPGLDVLGFATFPYTAGAPVSFDGMMIETKAMGDNSVSGNNFTGLKPTANQGKTAVHEAGHYLGLYHVFEPNPSAGNSTCASATAPNAYNDGDRCLDTKPCTQRFGGCSATNPCTGANDYPVDNFMNYLDQECKSNFSDDQVNLRMHPSLDDPNSSRNSLWQPANLILTGVSCGPCILDAGIEYTFTGPCPGVGAPVQFTAKTGSMYCSSSYTWTFPGAASISSTTISNPVVTYSVGGSYTAILKVCGPNNQCETKSVTFNVGASSIVAEVVNSTQTICSGSNALIEINIPQGGAPPFTINLSNGDVITGIWNRYTTWVLQNITSPQRITITSVNNNSCPATYTGEAVVNVISCCVQNLVVNGDFSAGNTGFLTSPNIDLTYNATAQSCGSYNVYNPTGTPVGTWMNVPQLQNLGNSYAIDFTNFGHHAGPPTYSILWAEDNIPITACTDYIISYNVSDAIVIPNLPVVLRFDILPATGTTPVFSQSYNVPINTLYNGAHPNIYWSQPTFAWNSGANAGSFKLMISQTTNYACAGGGDFMIDNVTLSKVTSNCIATTATALNICKGECANIGANLSAGATVKWSPVLGLSNPNIANPCASPQDTTTYTATVTINSGNMCGTSMYTVKVNVNSLTADDSIGENYVCSIPPAVTLKGVTVNGGVLPYTYNWGPAGNISPTNSLSPSVTQPGTYTLTITDAQNCAATVSSFVAVLPPMVLSIASANTGCSGCNGTVTLTNSSPATLEPFTYGWNTGATAQNLSALCPNTYSVTVTDNLGCQQILSTIVPQIIPLSATATINGCAGAISATATPAGDPPGPYTYRWSDGQTNATATNLASNTTYIVTVTSSNGCTAVASVTTGNGFNVAISATPVCSVGQTNTATVNVTGGSSPFTYLWSDGQATATANNLQPGATYTVVVTASNNCTASTSISFPNTLATAIFTAGLCTGGNGTQASVAPSGGTAPYTYLWSNHQTVSTATNLQPGNTYTVTVTTADNCTASNTVTIPSSLTVTIGVANNCTSASATAIAVGGNIPYSYIWSNGQSTATATGLATGSTHTVTVTTSDGCTTSQTASMATSLSVTATTSNVCASAGGATATAVGAGDVAPYTYAWSNGQNTATATGIMPATNYDVLCTSGNGCTASVNISLPLAPSTSITGQGACDNAATGTVILTVSDGTPPFTYLWNNQSTSQDIIKLKPGNYSVTVTDANRCIAVDSFIVTSLGNPVVTATPDTTVALGHIVQLEVVSATGGVAPWTYIWTPHDYLNDSIGLQVTATPIETTKFTVVGTDANGCVGVASSTINVTDPPLFIPNAFSPNGDGKNDVFYVYGSGVKDMHLRVFDRWGEMVFESRDITIGWDGTFNGQILKADVFAYEVEINYIDNSHKSAKGSISLVK